MPARADRGFPIAAGPLVGTEAIFDPRTPAADRTGALLRLLAGNEVPLALPASILDGA